jgi:hypothetical protein
VALLLADLGVTKTHARPHVSNDDPFSEAQFKTLKYRPAFPERFGSIQDVRAHCHVFFAWYNTEHRHGSLGLLTPADVHHGLAEQRIAARRTVLAAAYASHPERFPGRLPEPRACPQEVWINRPRTRVTDGASCHSAPATSFHVESAILDPDKALRLSSAHSFGVADRLGSANGKARGMQAPRSTTRTVRTR